MREEQFGRFVYPGTRIGTLNESVRKQTGLGEIPVLLLQDMIQPQQ